MMYRLSLLLLCCGGVFLSLSACSDPTGVGANLGDRSLQGGTPRTIKVIADSFDTVPGIAKTGFESVRTPGPGGSGSPNRSWRFLAGIVDDPLSGTITTQGYVDFFGTAPRDSALAAAPVDSLNAELRLSTTYFHGDTTSTLDLELYDLTEDADMARAPADTSFKREPLAIQSYRVSSPTDSLLTFELPESWIAEHESALQDSSEFGSAGSFQGFTLSPTTSSGNLVVGFEHASATLRLTTSTDTVDFQVEKSFTSIERSGSGNVPQGRTLIQDGVGPNLVLKWNFDDPPLDTLTGTTPNGGTPLNRAKITIPVDTAKMKEGLPSNFTRTRAGVSGINNYRILATRAKNAPECRQFGLIRLPNALDTCRLPTLPNFAPGAARVRAGIAFNIFDRALRDPPVFSKYQVQIAIQESPSSRNSIRRGLPSTVPALVRTSTPDTTNFPRATLVVTPL